MIIHPTFTPPPDPPRPTFSFVLRVLKRILAYWKAQMAAEYVRIGRLPAIVPESWTVERTLHFAAGGTHQPAFIATIERHTVRRNTMDLGAVAA